MNTLQIVDASPGEFEAGFSESGQTREHTLLLRGLGINRLIVVVNKMDVVEFDEARFEEVRNTLSEFLRQAGYKGNVSFVPCSGGMNENLVTPAPGRSRSTPCYVAFSNACIAPDNHPLRRWYTGGCLLEELDVPAGSQDRSLFEAPFCLSASDVAKGQNFGAVTISGTVGSQFHLAHVSSHSTSTPYGSQVIQGTVAVNDKVVALPMRQLMTVKALEIGSERVDLAFAHSGIVSLGLSGDLDPSNALPGTVLCDPQALVPIVTKFTGQIITMPTLARPVVHGEQVILHVGSYADAATISRLVEVIEKRPMDEARKPRRPRCLTKNQSAIVEITASRPLCIQPYAQVRQLGRFVLREKGATVALGIILDLL